jgi:hypothetical protein
MIDGNKTASYNFLTLQSIFNPPKERKAVCRLPGVKAGTRWTFQHHEKPLFGDCRSVSSLPEYSARISANVRSTTVVIGRSR